MSISPDTKTRIERKISMTTSTLPWACVHDMQDPNMGINQ